MDSLNLLKIQFNLIFFSRLLRWGHIAAQDISQRANTLCTYIFIFMGNLLDTLSYS